jgi:hypothetical protein
MRSVLPLVLAIALSGCGGSFRTEVEAFAGGNPPRKGESVLLIPLRPEEALETRTHVDLFRSAFQRLGFVVVHTSPADLIAVVSITSTGTRDVTSNFSIPRRGVTGYSAAMSIARTRDKGDIVFQAIAITTGECGMLPLLAPGLVAAIFEKFPNGGAGSGIQFLKGNC